MCEVGKVCTIKGKCIEFGVRRWYSFKNFIRTSKEEFYRFMNFVIFQIILFGITFQMISYFDNDGKGIVFFFYILINLWMTIQVDTVPRILVLLISMPAFFVTLYFEGRVSLDFFSGLRHFGLELFVYAVVWGWGAIVFNDKQYKVAISFIDAFLGTLLVFVAYVYYVNPDLIPENVGDPYKALSILLSPFVIARLYSKWVLDLMELIDSDMSIRKKIKENLVKASF